MKHLSPGSIVAERYRIVGLIGAGGMGSVFKALDLARDRVVALKILNRPASEADERQPFLREAAMSRHLEHPNILRVLDHGRDGDTLYLATQFVEGGSLARVLEDCTRLDTEYAVEIAVRVGTALIFAHWQGVIHRDVKPSNILISIDGNVFLADFDLAGRAGERTLTSGRTVRGTPAYMSPEQAMGDPLDARSDVFSLAAVLYETLTGRQWFAPEGEAIPVDEIIRRVVEKHPRSLRELAPEIPDTVDRVVLKALAKVPGERYQSADAFVKALLPSKAVPLGLLVAELTRPLEGTGSAPGNVTHDTGSSLRHLGDEPVGSMTESAQVSVSGDHPTVDVPAYLPLSENRVWEFASLWDELEEAAIKSREQFIALTETLARGPLREAIGYLITDPIPYFKGTVGFMVEAPFLWIRQSRFPLLFIAYDRSNHDLLTTVVHQLELARATEYFALLVVAPRGPAQGRPAEELRRVVANSVYRYDFVVLDRDHLASIIAHNSSRRLIEIILEQVDKLEALSPYVVRGPVPEKMFFGRESEIKTISQSIPRGDYALVGGRRIGKSSILLRLKRLLADDPRYRAIYMDCEARFDDEGFFDALRDLVDVPEGAEPLSFRRIAAQLRESSSPRHVVFLIDEIDELLAYDAGRQRPGQLFKMFRTASQEGLCRFVFSGSRTLDRHLRDPRSPFFNFCDLIRLKRLDDKSVAEIVRRPMHQLGIQIPDEERLIARLIDVTSSHPNIAQWVCDRLVSSCVDRHVSLKTLEDVTNASEFREHYVSTAWGDATPLEKLISLVVTGPEFTSKDVSREVAVHGLNNEAAVKEGLEFLQLGALFERTETGYRFGLSHFPRIVRKNGDVPAQIEAFASEARRSCS